MSRIPARGAAPGTVTQTFIAGAAYFALVFGAGFVLGIIRELWAVPRFGMRVAELIEAPIMLAVVIFTASWIIARTGLSPAAPARVGMGLIALVLLLAAEFAAVIWLRGLSIEEYIAARDPVSGSVYVVMLALYTMMPLAVLRR